MIQSIITAVLDRRALLALAGVRAVFAIAAIPLAPALYRDHFIILVLLRPTKEVLLAAGFLVRRGDVSLLPVLVAAGPLAVLGVWHFFALGRGYSSEIQSGKGLPRWAQRILPTDHIRNLCRVLDRRGGRVIVIGRLAAFPSALLGAAAGASKLAPRSFLPADGLGAALSIAEVMIAGYALGTAYKEAGPWLTAAGFGVLAVLLVVVGRWLRAAGAERKGKGKGSGSG